MKVWIEVEYNIGDIVYLKTDREQLERIVTAIKITAMGQLLYQLCQGTQVGDHYGIEISSTIDILKKVVQTE
jgi:SNF family Na+-dependent transporter